MRYGDVARYKINMSRYYQAIYWNEYYINKNILDNKFLIIL